MAVSRRLRFEILRRDGHTCRYCGASAPDVALTVDHVIPTTLGGGDEPNNLVTACQPCNAGKSSMPPDAAIVEDVDATALLFAKAVDRAAEQRRAAMDDLARQIMALDGSWAWWEDAAGRPAPRPDDWKESFTRFLSHGLNVEELDDMMSTAMRSTGARDPFRLFCSKAWREIGERQELALRMIEDGEV